jgi:hypothetical protein
MRLDRGRRKSSGAVWPAQIFGSQFYFAEQGSSQANCSDKVKLASDSVWGNCQSGTAVRIEGAKEAPFAFLTCDDIG